MAMDGFPLPTLEIVMHYAMPHVRKAIKYFHGMFSAVRAVLIVKANRLLEDNEEVDLLIRYLRMAVLHETRNHVTVSVDERTFHLIALLLRLVDRNYYIRHRRSMRHCMEEITLSASERQYLYYALTGSQP